MERIEFYSDYRMFLRDFYREKKKQYPYFSYRYFCQKAGISSAGLYNEVVSGKRNLTDRSIESFIKGLGLSTQDADYFRALVHFNQTENEQEKVQMLERLRGLKRRVHQQIVPLDMYEYFSNWYYPVLRELASLLDWNGNYRVLARSVVPPIKTAEARDAVRFLCEKGFLKIDTTGKYLQTSPALSTGSEVSSIAVKAFNQLMAQKGVEAIQIFPPTERDVRTLIFGASKKCFGTIKEEIRTFIGRIVRMVDDDHESDTVYSLSLQLFPMSRTPKQEEIPDEDA